jgi:hypothetical protein
MHARELDPTFVLFSDKAYFHDRGCVDSQYKSYWSAENCMVIHEESSHNVNFGFRYAISATRIIGPFFSETINSHRHVTPILITYFVTPARIRKNIGQLFSKTTQQLISHVIRLSV